MKRKWLIFKAIFLFTNLVSAQDQVTYIRQFQDVAVAEMLRTGIPASIKLAQGILESNCGKSDLACKANNHFGIKCGGDWDGKSFRKEDDDYENGRLVKSCFREFNSAMESYIAHSDFLTDPAKSSRYGFLFQFPVTDYKGWARGLSKAGYATDPQYAHRLIDIIEKYELYRFDNEYENPNVSVSPPSSAGYAMVRYQNDVKYMVALAGDNPRIVADRYDVTARQLLRYNEQLLSEDEPLAAGSKIYLQPKRNTYHGKQKYHLLKPGEDMMTLSQQYGVKLDALLKRNGLDKNEVPAPKQKILLKGKRKDPLKTIQPSHTPAIKPSPESTGITASADVASPSLHSAGPASADVHLVKTSGNIKAGQAADPAHTVAKGETLYGIARTYGLSVDELKKRNNLSADTIFVGQKLVLR